MAGVAGEEDAVGFGEVVGEALADGVDGPPGGVGDVHRVGVEDLAGCFVEVGEFDVFDYCSLGELDVKSHQGTAFSRDYLSRVLVIMACKFRQNSPATSQTLTGELPSA